MKRVIIGLIAFLAILSFTLPVHAYDKQEFKRLLEQSWTLGYESGDNSRCEHLHQRLLNDAARKGQISPSHFRVLRLFYNVCRVGVKDRLEGKNHLWEILDAVK